MKYILTFAMLVLSFQSQAQTTQDGPTMGWSSWNTFGINISETTIKAQASAMKSKGLATVGYNHINIDDGYFGGRDQKTGELLIHKKRFPKGLAPVVDYIHKLNMKAGIYSDAGKNTCGNYHNGDTIAHDVGLYGYDQRDCDFFFKELGFDFIKVDFCGGVSYHNSEHLDLDCEERYKAIAQAIANTGRTDVRLNVCRWDYPGHWVHDIATSWRTTGDINASWGSIRDIISQNLYLSAYCYDGHYNDMDMLEVGRGIGTEEDQTHFGMWCIMCSPLLIGCDVSQIPNATLRLLKNKDLIALNQDSLHLQAYVVQHVGGTYVLVKDIEELQGHTRAVALYNPTDEAVDMSIAFDDLDLGGTVEVRDLCAGKDLGTMNETLSMRVPAHGTRIYRLQAETRYERTLYEAETAYLGRYQEIFNNAAYESAIPEDNNAASGGMVAGWLGKRADNDIQWRHVYSDLGGEYTLTIRYVSGENRNMTLDINGKTIRTFTGCNSGGWGSAATKSLKVTLQPGYNVIRLYNASAWMPSIDYISLKSTSTTDRLTVGVEPIQAKPQTRDNKYYTIDGRSTAEPQHGLFIHQGKKIMKPGAE